MNVWASVTRDKSAVWRFLTAMGLVAVVLAPSAHGVVVLRDGFGDGDINNNGIAFEDVDTDVGPTAPLGTAGTYVPARLRDVAGNGPANTEVSTALDASDTGLRWLQMRGFTGGTTTTAGTGPSKPTIRIVDDAQGAMQETMASGLNIGAINSGYAMSWESRGGGSAAGAFFDRSIELGPEVGDSVKVSFDFRMWRDAPNANTALEPVAGELRFGLFQDTDNQLGMTNPLAGRQVDLNNDGFIDNVPAIWGQEEGLFDGSITSAQGAGGGIGAIGDNGWTASLFTGASFLANGGGTRIREEINIDRLLQGNDIHTIAQPVNTNPDPFGVPTYDFVTLDNSRVYSISLELTRATEVTAGDTITSTLSVVDKLTQQTWSLSGTETLADSTSGGVPIPGTGGVQSDSWDYFAIKNQSSGSSEFDFVMDNFVVEVEGSNANPGLAGDANGDGKVDLLDLDILGANFGASGGATLAQGDFNSDGSVNLLDLDILGANFGAMQMATAIPEPAAIVSLVGLLCISLRRRR